MKKSKSGFWICVLPALICFAMVVLIPAITGLLYSFTDWNGMNKPVSFAGLENYRGLISDKVFWRDFLYTAEFSVVAVILVNLLGFALALLVTQKIRGANLFRTVFFMPNLIGGILLGFAWQFVFTQGFNYLGKSLNISWLQGWLSTPFTSTVGLMIVVVWQQAGYMMIVYIAQLQSIPDNLIEAAEIDGAGRLQRLKNLILPLCMPAFTIGFFLTLSGTFRLYDQNLALTNGGPYGSTQMVCKNIYRTAFGENDLGRAQAKALIFVIVIAIVSLTQLYCSKKMEVEM